MKTRIVGVLAIVLFITLNFLPADAAIKPGQACKKVGSFAVVGAYKYTCIKSGKKTLWNKGVKILVVKLTPTPASSPTPTLTQMPTPAPTSVSTPKPSPSSTAEPGLEIKIGPNLQGWHIDGGLNKWVSPGNVPECIFPIFPENLLVDFSAVQWLIAPGQFRSNDYKAHGVIRWSTHPEPYLSGIIVRLPFDATVISAQNDYSGIDYQFSLNAISDCGIMIHLAHLFEPGPEVKKILDFVKPLQEGQSNEIPIVVRLKKGTVIATNVGQPTSRAEGAGSQMDFGLLDLRRPNPNKPLSYHGDPKNYYPIYSVCWLEGQWFSEKDRRMISQLPVTLGLANSDYCGK